MRRTPKYRLEALLGQGGMAQVYEVVHEATGQRLAMKVLMAAYWRNRMALSRFEREARAMGALRHHNIVDVRDFGYFEDGAPYTVMELLTGICLADAMVLGPLEPQRAFHIAAQILDALDHAHRVGVIHRDLSAGNVMLVPHPDPDAAGEMVKLIDFGVAKLSGEAELAAGKGPPTRIGAVFGTPGYIAPEQADGRVVDERADLYSLGVILFEMLTGRRPFVDRDGGQVVRMHLGAKPPTLRDASRGRLFGAAIERFVARALAKRPEDRFASAAAMRAALDEIVAPVPLAAKPSFHAWGEALAGSRRQALAFAGGAFVAGLLLAAFLA